MSQEAKKPSRAGTVPPPLPAPKRCPDIMIDYYIFFSMPVLLSPQRNFSFHEINSDYIKFHFSETKI